MGGRVVAVLGHGVVPAGTPIVRGDDLGILRGDGVFETLHVRGGKPWLLDEHLDRMIDSARALDLNLPDRARLSTLADQACAAWPAGEEGALRLVCTRGPEDGDGPATGYAVVTGVGEPALRARRDGISVITMTLGVPATLRPTAPWLLAGAKTLSYAMNMATLRWATAHGADDALWISTDGYLLEAPTATLVWLHDGVLCTVPPEQTAVLAGTTAAWLLDHAEDVGFTAAHRMIRPAELAATEGAWLTSSVRGITEIRSVDGVSRPESPHTSRLRRFLGY